MKKDLKIYLGLIIIVIAIIILILFLKKQNPNNQELTESLAKCIASKSIMYSQTGCSHCKTQKSLLEPFISEFNIIECDKNPKACSDAGILGTPTWVINNQKYENVQPIKKLRELTGC
jgi:glutaredoxin